MKTFLLTRRQLVTSLMLAALGHRLTAVARAEEPRWFKLNGMPQASLGMEVEGSTETTRIGGNESTYDHLFLTPLLGLQTSGSIYHPNLLAFDLNGDFGYGWDSTTTRSSSGSRSRHENDQLQRYFAQIVLLQAKPYNASFFASQDHTFRDYGTFDTYTVDSERYGGRMNWNTKNLSLNTEFGYRNESATGLMDTSEISETYFNFMGLHRRKSGQTTLTFRLDQFENTFNLGKQTTTMNESVGISDAETFGARKHITAATGLSFGHSQYAGRESETINANEHISVRHRPRLDSYLMLDFGHNHLHPETQSRLQGVYNLRHQLYESLTSNADIHGNHQENNGLQSASTTDRYGAGVFENYTKRLKSWGRLTAALGFVLDHEDDDSSGTVFTSIDESHLLYLPTSSDFRPVFLNRPRVLPGSIQVHVNGDVLILASDYQVITSGELTEIRLLVPTSSHLQSLLQGNESLTVAVTYQSSSLNNASFESFSASAQIRLDYHDVLGVYGRLNWMDNNAPSDVLVQRLTDLVAGVDFRWEWLRAGAEYESYDSNFSKFEALRFFQNLDFRLSGRSTVNVNFNESFYHYPAGREQTQYQFLVRYNARLWSSFQWYVEGGMMWQDVFGSDQLQGSARTGFSWTRGKLTVRAGYEYNTQSSTTGVWTEEREKHRLYGYMKRQF